MSREGINRPPLPLPPPPPLLHSLFSNARTLSAECASMGQSEEVRPQPIKRRTNQTGFFELIRGSKKGAEKNEESTAGEINPWFLS